MHYYPSTTQSVATGAASAAITNPVGDHIQVVRLVATAACHVAFGDAPAATASDMYLPADEPEYFTIHPGQKVAAIQDSAAGVLYVTEMTR